MLRGAFLVSPEGAAMNEMMRQKLSKELQEMIESHTVPDPVSVIVQVRGNGEGEDRLNDQDRQMIDTIGGKILDDLWLIKGFSADIPSSGLEKLVLSPRVFQVHHNTDLSGSEE
jgi:hypothetical protein